MLTETGSFYNCTPCNEHVKEICSEHSDDKLSYISWYALAISAIGPTPQASTKNSEMEQHKLPSIPTYRLVNAAPFTLMQEKEVSSSKTTRSFRATYFFASSNCSGLLV